MRQFYLRPIGRFNLKMPSSILGSSRVRAGLPERFGSRSGGGQVRQVLDRSMDIMK